jgi:hypothetical protein
MVRPLRVGRGWAAHDQPRQGHFFKGNHKKIVVSGLAVSGHGGTLPATAGRDEPSPGKTRAVLTLSREAFMKQTAVGKLVIDYNLYPRFEVDPQHVHYIREAIRAGVTLPPVIAIEKDLRIVDGVHRTNAYLKEFGPEHPIDVVLKSYKTDALAFQDAIRLNAGHGRALTRYDRVHSILRAEELGLSVDETAAAMGMTVKSLGELRADRIGVLRAPGKEKEEKPLKRTISHMAGKQLTEAQITANDKLGGMNQSFYVNQLITLIENGLLDTKNERLMRRLAVLSRLLLNMKGIPEKELAS